MTIMILAGLLSDSPRSLAAAQDTHNLDAVDFPEEDYGFLRRVEAKSLSQIIAWLTCAARSSVSRQEKRVKITFRRC